MNLRIIKTTIVTFTAFALMSGCTTFGTVFEDSSIESRVSTLLEPVAQNNPPAFIGIDSHNLYVLIYGQVPTEEAKSQASQAINGVAEVRKVFNELRVANPDDKSGFKDSWTTTKVKSSLAAEKGLDSKRIKVRTEHNEVFLMGLVTRAEGDKAALVVRNISGVTKVVKIFEYID